MTTLNVDQITELLKDEEKTPAKKDGVWVCPKCHRWTTSQAGAKYHRCEK